MTTQVPERASAPGGSFMTSPVEAGSVYTPERLTDQHRAIRDAVSAFVEKEVGPRRKAVEARDYATHRALMERLGSDGFLGIDVPEAYGGTGLDRITSLVVNEAIAATFPASPMAPESAPTA